jgi:phage-related protein
LRDSGLQVSNNIAKKIEPDLWEIRCEGSTNNPRILHTTIGNRIVLLHGFAKTGQKNNQVSEHDKQIARARRQIQLDRENDTSDET